MARRVLTAETGAQVAEAAAEAARAVAAGQLVGFATETVYGIAALASNAATMERLRELKARPSRPFSVHLGRSEDVGRYIANIPADAKRLIRKAWPGPITLLLPTGGSLADKRLQSAGLHDVLTSDNMIGLRFPDEPVSIAMLSAVDGPVVAPSANLAGQPSPRTAAEVIEGLGDGIDLLVDSGPTRYGKDSTIISFDQAGQISIIRQGVYDERTIRRLLLRTYVFVCTGNTCRSPIAAGLARKILAERLDTTPAQLSSKGVEVASAGLYASSGNPATPEAVTAAKDFGADISHHRSQKLSIELINAADMIFCMTSFHAEQVRQMVPAAAEKVVTLDSQADIPDPIGAGQDVYRQTAQRIELALRRTFEELP